LYGIGSDDQEVVFDEFPFLIDEMIDFITGNHFPFPTPGTEYKIKLPPTALCCCLQPIIFV
jgi:hypothetical protein